MKQFQRGLGMITAIIILVILAALAAAMISFGTTQQLTSAQDVMSVKAWQATKAGNEWGMYMALKSVPECAASKTIDLTAELGFQVSVRCSASTFNEGECALSDTDPACVVDPLDPGRKIRTVTLYTITSIASNGASVTSPGYVERSRAVIVAN